ncbi:transposase [Bradyrhizobium sp. USDA 3240]
MMASFFARLPACLVGMEASNGARYWALACSRSLAIRSD